MIYYFSSRQTWRRVLNATSARGEFWTNSNSFNTSKVTTKPKINIMGRVRYSAVRKLHDLKSEVTPFLLWFQISFIFSEDISGGREASDQVNPTTDQRSDSTGNTVTAQTRGKPTVAASTKTTRSGRVSKPRSRDLDTVPAFPLNSDRPEVCALRNQN